MKAHLYPEQALKRRAMSWAVRLKVNPGTLRFEQLTDRWGYCSPAGEVTFALDLLDQDERFRDYVIVHELLHLRVRSHGKRFHALLSAYVPEWRDLDQPDPARGRCDVRGQRGTGQETPSASAIRRSSEGSR
jgi:predicted metal-dependent hydrolase